MAAIVMPAGNTIIAERTPTDTSEDRVAPPRARSTRLTVRLPTTTMARQEILRVRLKGLQTGAHTIPMRRCSTLRISTRLTRSGRMLRVTRMRSNALSIM
jgi:hypothetical protein